MVDLSNLMANKPQAKPAEVKPGEPLAPAAAVVVESKPEPEVGDKMYTSHPIENFKMGKFQFVKGVLTLDNAEDISQFEKLLSTLPARERNVVKTISMAAALAMVRPQEPGVTQNFDSSVGRQRETIAGSSTIGTQRMEDPTRTESRDDMNIAVNEGQPDGTVVRQG